MIDSTNHFFAFVNGDLTDPKYVYVDFDEDQEPMMFDTTGDELLLVYGEGEFNEHISEGSDPNSLLDLSDGSVERAYMMRTGGYRGEQVYAAFVKVNGKWYDCDIGSEGTGIELTSGLEYLEQGDIDKLFMSDDEDDYDEEE